MGEPLKNCYNNAYFSTLEDKLIQAYPSFNAKQFRSKVYAKGWKQLELKARMSRIAQALQQSLPQDYATAIDILMEVSCHFHGWQAMFFSEFVLRYGLDNYPVSIKAMAEFTRHSSSEFAIRPFIEKYEHKTMLQMQRWAQDNNEHLRRLASEGCRPRLPWASQLKDYIQNPEPVIDILQLLKTDDSEYVRRSVANNLNDISKDHPQRVLGICQQWLTNGDQRSRKIVKHACRSLLKKGNRQALEMFGFLPPDHIELNEIDANEIVTLGDAINFSFVVTTSKHQLGLLRLEYAIDFLKANGKQSRKIFKLSEADINVPRKNVQKQHKFVDLSTRKHYPGEHALSIIVNGEVKHRQCFDLLAE